MGGVLVALSLICVSLPTRGEKPPENAPPATFTAMLSATPTTAPTATPVLPTLTPQPSPTYTPLPTLTPTRVKTPEPVTFKGSGSRALPKFGLLSGIAIFEMSHDGTANFIVELMSEAGETVDLLVNTIGSYTGTKAIGVQEGALLGAEPGMHLLNVQADGSWAITIRQPRFSSAPGLPQSFSGSGDGASTPFMLDEDIAMFTLTHNGSANFIVELLSAEGNLADLLVNEIGSYEGSKAVGIRNGAIIGPQPGIHLLNITADGAWTVTIE